MSWLPPVEAPVRIVFEPGFTNRSVGGYKIGDRIAPVRELKERIVGRAYSPTAG